MKKFIPIVFILLLCNVVKSETVKWVVQPRYDYITYFSTDIFKCVKDKHIQLLDWTGVPLVDQDLLIDSVTDFTDGYALLLKNESHGYKIIGFITEQKDHLFQNVNDEYFVTQYPFFSEGYLVVSDAKGKMGYLDETGQCVIECKYDNARPFRKGLASVQFNVNKNESRVYYINPLGQTKNPLEFYDGKIDKGSNFNDEGEAVVKHDRECAIIDRNMKVVRKRPYDRVFPIRTYDYAYSEDYANPTPNVNQKPTYDERFVVFENESGFGYQSVGNEVVVPAQFDKALPICNSRAIVAMGDKYGVLELVEGKISLDYSLNTDELIVYPEMNYRSIGYEVQIPDSFDKNRLHLWLDKGDGNFDEAAFTMEFKPLFNEGAKFCTLRTQLRSDDGLLLLEDVKSINIAYVRIDLCNPETGSTYAMENGIQKIKACIINNSEFEVEVSPSFVVSFGRNSKNKIQSRFDSQLVVLKPNERKELLVGVKVVENENVNAEISVSVDGFECGRVSSLVSLKTI